MKHIYLLFIITGGLMAACTKKSPEVPVPQPPVEMVYTDLNNYQVEYRQRGLTIDVNNDGRSDLFFGVQLVGDQINKIDKRQYVAFSSLFTALPVNSNDQVMPMNSNDMIPLNNFNGNNWYEATEIILIERNEFENGTIVWRGNWLDSERKYLPFQYWDNNKRYNGWVELTADQNSERLILHRMAISKHPEKEIKAGG
jgi:hypothetical protein